MVVGTTPPCIHPPSEPFLLASLGLFAFGLTGLIVQSHIETCLADQVQEAEISCQSPASGLCWQDLT
eukprot:9977297-Karenia_brevis.AAC.1